MTGWRLAFANLRFHATRSTLTVLAVALATALTLSTLAFQRGYERSLQRNIETMGYQVLVTGKGCPHEAATLILRGGSIPMYIQSEMAERIASLPEVAASTRFFMQALPAPETGATQLHVGIDAEFLRLKPSVVFQEGGWFSSETAEEVVLGYNVAEYRDVVIGDELTVLGRPFVVRGVLDQLGTQDDGTIFLPLLTAQTIFDRRDQLTGMGLQLKDPEQAATLVDRLHDLPSVQVVRLSQVQSAILQVLAGVRTLLTAFGFLCLVVALLGVLNVALLSAAERREEMGVLRAMGCPAGTLFRLAWMESLLLSLAGAGVGVLLSVLARGAVEGFLRASLSFVPAGPVLVFEPDLILGGVLLVVVLCLLAGAWPAWRSSRVSPLRTIRGAAAWG